MYKIFNFVKILLFVLVFTAFLVGSAEAGCPVGDLNGDCEVDFNDLRILAEQWLNDPNGPMDSNYPDLLKN